MGDKDEIPFDLKNDIKIGFELFKNENNKINKLKLRTLLFSFIMFESSAGDINKYIEQKISPDQDLFDLEDVYNLVKDKLRHAKSKEADELLNFINGNETSDVVKESDLSKAFQKHKIDISPKEIKEMFLYMNPENENIINFNNLDKKEKDKENKEKDKEKEKELTISKEKFRNFYIDN